MAPTEINAFIHDLKFEDLDADVIHSAKRCLLDTIAVAAAGRKTPCADIICQHAVSYYGSTPGQPGGRILFDGRRASLPGAVLSNAMLIDSVDAHDTDFGTKGHIGVAIVPALLALAEEKPVSGKEFLTSMVMGYEVAQRVGVSLHGTVSDYHTSGSWSSIGCAALVARFRQLSTSATREGLGIAEYYGPRSQMMRCIEFPTMVKDGSGWGAMVGVSAGLMAELGFTGAPAITVESSDVADVWKDLGKEWVMKVQCFKPYPTCYWSQPGLASLRSILASNTIDSSEIEQVTVYTHHDASKLHTANPKTTEEAQYSYPFPLACYVCKGKCGVEEITDGIGDTEVVQMAQRVKLVHSADYQKDYPYKNLAHVEISLKDGRSIKGPKMDPWGWGAKDSIAGPLTDKDLLEKCKDYLGYQLPEDKTREVIEVISNIEKYENVVEALEPVFNV